MSTFGSAVGAEKAAKGKRAATASPEIFIVRVKRGLKGAWVQRSDCALGCSWLYSQ
jgi:hypothetical protein